MSFSHRINIIKCQQRGGDNGLLSQEGWDSIAANDQQTCVPPRRVFDAPSSARGGREGLEKTAPPPCISLQLD